ncbi:MAG: HAD family phosphatase [candidate division KSB1 bacterium]|nr:HAD family phosphatase [candidate division KSB1 bacterium]
MGRCGAGDSVRGRGKAILCDLGGVVALFDEERIFEKLQQVASVDLREERTARLVAETKELFDRGHLGPREFYDRLREAIGLNVDYPTFTRVWSDNFWPNHEVINLLGTLRGRYRLVLLSNTDPLHWDFIDRSFAVGRLFDALVLSYRVGSIKPERKIFEVALEVAGVKAQDALFVDDTERNVLAARELGIHALLYRPGLDLMREIAKVFAEERDHRLSEGVGDVTPVRK